ncbi:hypothetical protein [Azospirillum agricola]|uniref:hypothetical protein n=1 Tax=Azospirillum agricola TaxID=1720247 RepID=UPI000A0F21D5|nr:hypothetical protein [Azospirillum agricola]SMH56357.1 hypothetical protein SAMN02982994_4053 [Azospirillum lipoferum]
MFRLQDIPKTCETIMLLTMALTSVVLEAARLDRPRDRPRDRPARPAAEREPFRLAYAPAIAPRAEPGPSMAFCSMVSPAPAASARLHGRVLVED